MISASHRPFDVRDSGDGDVAYVYSSWLRQHWATVRGGQLSKFVFMPGHHRAIEQAMKRSRCLVACALDDPNQILGWVAFEHVGDVAVVHYVYVKKAFRRLGIGRELARLAAHARASVRHTHLPLTGGAPEAVDAASMIERMQSVFDPYLFGGVP